MVVLGKYHAGKLRSLTIIDYSLLDILYEFVRKITFHFFQNLNAVVLHCHIRAYISSFFLPLYEIPFGLE